MFKRITILVSLLIGYALAQPYPFTPEIDFQVSDDLEFHTGVNLTLTVVQDAGEQDLRKFVIESPEGGFDLAGLAIDDLVGLGTFLANNDNACDEAYAQGAGGLGGGYLCSNHDDDTYVEVEALVWWISGDGNTVGASVEVTASNNPLLEVGDAVSGLSFQNITRGSLRVESQALGSDGTDFTIGYTSELTILGLLTNPDRGSWAISTEFFPLVTAPPASNYFNVDFVEIYCDGMDSCDECPEISYGGPANPNYNTIDDCGVCWDEPGYSIFFGTAPGDDCGCTGEVIDDCGDCDGFNAAQDDCGLCPADLGFGTFFGANAGDSCDCFGAVIDECDWCTGGTDMGGAGAFDYNWQMDCAGECLGAAIDDDCGFCPIDPEFGTFFGLLPGDACDCSGAVIDDCGDCGGMNAAQDDCGFCPADPGFGTYFGSLTGDVCGCAGEVLDECLVCDGDAYAADCLGVDTCAGMDCNGECAGSAVIDNCNDCVEGSTGLMFDYALDCAGDCDGTAYLADYWFDSDADGWGDMFDGNYCSDSIPVGAALMGGDNCPGTFNPDQLNTDGDAFGDVCDAHPYGECEVTFGSYSVVTGFLNLRYDCDVDVYAYQATVTTGEPTFAGENWTVTDSYTDCMVSYEQHVGGGDWTIQGFSNSRTDCSLPAGNGVLVEIAFNPWGGADDFCLNLPTMAMHDLGENPIYVTVGGCFDMGSAPFDCYHVYNGTDLPQNYYVDTDVDGLGCGDSQGMFCPSDSEGLIAPLADPALVANVDDLCCNDFDNDIDSDGVCGDVDNCVDTWNDTQVDTDGDGAGDACDDTPWGDVEIEFTIVEYNAELGYLTIGYRANVPIWSFMVQLDPITSYVLGEEFDIIGITSPLANYNVSWINTSLYGFPAPSVYPPFAPADPEDPMDYAELLTLNFVPFGGATVCFGDAYIFSDFHNEPLDVVTGDCVEAPAAPADCAGVYFGVAEEDACGICAGGTTGLTPNTDSGGGFIVGPDADECGICFGDGFVATCEDTDDCVNMDCNGNCAGTAMLDSCDVCSGGLSGHPADVDIDCNGDCFGTASPDECGVCSGGNSGHLANSDFIHCPDYDLDGLGDPDMGTWDNYCSLDEVPDGWVPEVDCTDPYPEGEATIYFGTSRTTGSIDVLYTSDVPIYGYQFNVPGLYITGIDLPVSATDCESFTTEGECGAESNWCNWSPPLFGNPGYCESGWTAQFNSNTGGILVFGNTGGYYGPEIGGDEVVDGLLATLYYSLEDTFDPMADPNEELELCITNATVSGAPGTQPYTVVGGCEMLTEPDVDCSFVYNGDNVPDCFGVCGGTAVMMECGCDEPLPAGACNCAGDTEDDCGNCPGIYFNDIDLDGLPDGCDPYPYGDAFFYIGSVDEQAGTIDILVDNNMPLYGFEFDVTDVNLFQGINEGTNNTPNFGIDVDGMTVTGYSVYNANIPAGLGNLAATLSFTPFAGGEVCLAPTPPALMAHAFGFANNIFGVTLGDCVPIPACVQDCADVWCGEADIDSCGICAGGDTGLVPDADELGCGCFEPAALTYCTDFDGDDQGTPGTDMSFCLPDVPNDYVLGPCDDPTPEGETDLYFDNLVQCGSDPFGTLDVMYTSDVFIRGFTLEVSNEIPITGVVSSVDGMQVGFNELPGLSKYIIVGFALPSDPLPQYAPTAVPEVFVTIQFTYGPAAQIAFLDALIAGYPGTSPFETIGGPLSVPEAPMDECSEYCGPGILPGNCDCAGNILDECGVCGGAGIPAGDCDCFGNVDDECGVCGGTGIPAGDCDCLGNVDDECGVCGGPGILPGECDCAGNVLDECGVCGGAGIPAGDCDCFGNVDDECGVCGGTGIPAGDCDCLGNVLDECGVCGGDGIPAGDCDCYGNVDDACGVCDGPGTTTYYYDLDGDMMGESIDCMDLEFCPGDMIPDGYVLDNSDQTPDGETTITFEYDPVNYAVNINYESDVDIYGIQATTSGINFTGGSTWNTPPYSLSVNGNVLLLFAFSNDAPFPAGNGTLGTLYYEFGPQAEVTFSNVTVAGTPPLCPGDFGHAPVAYWNSPLTIPEPPMDECGVYFGPGILPGECDCDGNVLDECGVCGGPGILPDECDCAGNVLDECGVCDGPGIPAGDCDCFGNVDDECGVCGGTGIPAGDCDCFGNVEDECGVCGGPGILPGDCDCDGNVLDECGVCGGTGIPAGDCDCFGNVDDECGVCGGTGIPAGDCDCFGNVDDECGVCDGPGILPGECDCAGNIDDDCGDCGGTLFFGSDPGDDCGCTGEIVDACGLCDGDDSTCTGCLDPTAVNYDAGWIIPCMDCCVYSYPIELSEGPNLISFYGLPGDASLANVLAPLDGNVYGVIGEGVAAQPHPLNPGQWIGGLSQFTLYGGYWLKMNSDAVLDIFDWGTVSGGIVYSLHAGSNLISYSWDVPNAIGDALPMAFQDQILGIISQDASGLPAAAVHHPLWDIDPAFHGVWLGTSLTEFLPTRGYWFKMASPQSFAYNDPTLLSKDRPATILPTVPVAFEYERSTKPAFYYVYEASINGQPLSSNDWIVAYNGDVVVGARQWADGYIDVPVMGYDGELNTAGYCVEGDTPTFKVFVDATGELVDMSAVGEAWSENGIFYIATMESTIEIPETVSFHSAYPNPFNPVTTIEYSIPAEMNVQISIIDMNGREVASLMNDVQTEGYHTVSWNAQGQSSGVYFIRMATNESVNIQKVLLVK